MARTPAAVRIVTVGFAGVLVAVAALAYFAGLQGREKDRAAVLSFHQNSAKARHEILGCLDASRPAGLNLSEPEPQDGFTRDLGTFGPLTLRKDDLYNGARHIVVRVTEQGSSRELQVWTRRDTPLPATDIAVISACAGKA